MPHNGGTTQLNFNFLPNPGDHALINYAKKFGRLTPRDGTTHDATKHDANGYMTTTYGSGVGWRLNLPSQANRPGNYIIKWDDTGVVKFAGADGNINGSGTYTSSSLTDGRIELTITATVIDFTIVSVGSPYLKNLRICHVDDEDDLDAGEYWQQGFVDLLLNAKIGVLRFMNWQDTNNVNSVSWSDRNSVDHISWTIGPERLDLHAGLTGGTGDDYTATLSGFALVDKARIVVKFDRTSSGISPTLNVGGTGAKGISTKSCAPLTSGSKPVSGNEASLIFDESLDTWLIFGGTDYTGGAINDGIPVLPMLDLCERVGAHPWFCIPHLACDPLSDYTTELATYVKTWTDANASWMVPRYEVGNEIWNTIFPGTQYALFKECHRLATVWRGDWATATDYSVGDGFRNGGFCFTVLSAHNSSSATYNSTTGPDGNLNQNTYPELQKAFDWNNWYGRASAKVGKAISAVYSDDRTKYHMISGCFVAGISPSRLDSTIYLTEPGIVAGDAAKYWMTHIAVAPYVLSEVQGTTTYGAWATSTSYSSGAVVGNGGSYYLCYSSHTSGSSTEPGVGGSWSTRWYVYTAGPNTEALLAAEYTTATDARKTEIIDIYAGAEGRGLYGAGWPVYETLFPSLKTVADGYGLPLTMYEGGYQAYANSTTEINTLRIASNLSQKLHRLTHKRYQVYAANGVENVSHFDFSGGTTWSLFYPTRFDTPSPQWDAISNWNRGIRRYLFTTS